MSNRLANEKSPYLLQHAQNPVDWMPWGAEAFEKARREDKPIFLSVGYSTCHWCHVMAHESFENPSVAELVNRLFVNVKVDREERPDVDRMNMAFVQATTGQGGWPMSVWLTPDLKPFYGGTYFPPEDNAYGRPGFESVCRMVDQTWRERRAEVLEQSEMAMATLERDGAHTTIGGDLPSEAALSLVLRHFQQNFDGEWGGFGRAPKFPRPSVLNLLFRLYAREPKDSPTGASALRMGLFTLRTMADGGLRDQIGGGFHRYSVDRYWHVPHFEKMLYDQAQLSMAYLEAWQMTGDVMFADVARDTLDYVRREMTDSAGGFYSAEDADSLLEVGKSEHAEGAYYVWSREEIVRLLDEDADLFCAVYGVEETGNAPKGSDPHGEFTGKNILNRRLSNTEAADKFKLRLVEVSKRLARCREVLLQARSIRPRPHLDDKIITAWNGLMISAYARCAWALEDGVYLRCAQNAAKFLQKELWDGQKLIRSFRHGASNVEAFAEDYAFLIQGMLDLHEASGQKAWLDWALELQGVMDAKFWDDMGGGYFSSREDDPHLPLRLKEDYDGAEPSANSVACLNLLRLELFANDARFRKKAEDILKAFCRVAEQLPHAVPNLLIGAEWALRPPRQIVLVGKTETPGYREMQRELRKKFLMRTVLLQRSPEALEQDPNPALFAMKDGPVPAAYVCKNFTCQLPAQTAEELAKQL